MMTKVNPDRVSAPLYFMTDREFTAEAQRTQRVRREKFYSAPTLRPLRLCGEQASFSQNSKVLMSRNCRKLCYRIEHL